MEEMTGIPYDSTADTEAFSYYTHPMTPLLSQEAEYEVFGSPWMSTSSGTVSVSAASALDAANTRNSLQKSGLSSLEEATSSAIRAKISSHPLYPKLLQAYIDCHKVGAPPETASLLDKILQENDYSSKTTVSYGVGEDPELDEFMETYCEVLAKYKLDLARPYDEASAFLSSIETQLSKLCNNPTRVLDEVAGSSNDDTSSAEVDVQECKEMPEVREIKDRLLHKYSGYITSLRHEVFRKKQKVKFPADARQILLNWWKIHYNWPYPTEADKVALAETTGLDQKQINNWFINQRKRHWKPSENLKPFVMSNLQLHGSFFPE